MDDEYIDCCSINGWTDQRINKWLTGLRDGWLTGCRVA